MPPAQQSVTEPAAQASQTAGTQQTGQADPGATGSVSSGKAGQQYNQMDAAHLQKALQQLNQMLDGAGTKVVMDPKAPPNDLWLNVVDTKTGAVIEHLPPEGLRQFAQTASAKGLTLDLKF